MGEGFVTAAGIFLLMATIAAPWLFGSTRHWTIIRLTEILCLMGLCWGAGVLLRWPKVLWEGVTEYCVIFLLMSGWLMAITGPVLPSDPFTEKHFAELAARWPGSFVIKTPVETMCLFSGLLVALLVTRRLSVEKVWKVVLFRSLAIVGVSIAAVGIAQVKTGARGIFWDTTIQYPGYFFATFFHHTVAGAYINLVWPLCAGVFGWLCCTPSGGGNSRVAGLLIWGLMMSITLCALAVQVSKFAVINAAFLVLLFVSWLLWRLRMQAFKRVAFRFCCIGVLLLLVAGATARKGGRWDTLLERWKPFVTFASETAKPESQEKSGRKPALYMRPDGFIESSGALSVEHGHFLGYQRVASAVCLRMIPQAGLLGFGPGSWTGSYPHFTKDPFLRTFFLGLQFANVDYLQTIVEWGLLGAAAWGVLAFGGVWRGMKRLAKSRAAGGDITEDEGMTAGMVLSLTGVLIHALIDFPLQIPSIQLFVMVLLGLLWSDERSRRAGRTRVGDGEMGVPSA